MASRYRAGLMLSLLSALLLMPMSAQGVEAQDAAVPVQGYGITSGDTGFTGDLLLDISWKLGLVLLLACGALWLARHGVKLNRSPKERELEVLESVSLGAQRSLHLVRARGQVLLVGATAQQISTLAELGEAALVEPSAEAADSVAPPLPVPASLHSKALDRLRHVAATSLAGK